MEADGAPPPVGFNSDGTAELMVMGSVCAA
jgi:hypothetical protein